jgi:hypothetical protein
MVGQSLKRRSSRLMREKCRQMMKQKGGRRVMVLDREERSSML